MKKKKSENAIGIDESTSEVNKTIVDGLEVETISEAVNTTKKKRRPSGSGSIYPIYIKGELYKYGYCLQLGKAPDGFRLRHLKSFKTLDEVEQKLEEAKQIIPELYQLHLEKYYKKNNITLVVDNADEKDDTNTNT